MSDCPTCRGFLVAVLADPDRDDTRLIYADHLDEHGKAEKFINIHP